jgi:hypothetical protein
MQHRQFHFKTRFLNFGSQNVILIRRILTQFYIMKFVSATFSCPQIPAYWKMTTIALDLNTYQE